MREYLAAETWGLCDFRHTAGPFNSMQAAEDAAAGWKAPACSESSFIRGQIVNPGSDVAVGDWFTAQDGMVAPHESQCAALQWLTDVCDDCTVDDGHGGHRPMRNDENGVGQVFVGRVVKILNTLSDPRAEGGAPKVTWVLIEVASGLRA